MNDFEEQLRNLARQEPPEVPESFSNRVEETLSALPRQPRRIVRLRRVLLSAAAVLALLVALPNFNSSIAYAMGQLPVVGALFQAVTFRTYEVEEGENHVSIEVPQVMPQTADQAESEGAQQINEKVTDYTDRLIAEYEEQMHADGYFNLDVTWEVVTDTDRWFTLRINTDLVMASGNHEERYYHIDAATGQERTLSDLFPADYDYVTVISDELKTQMQARMDADAREIYWLEGVSQLGTYYFDAIDPEHNFYFDNDGKLVIPFNKYEVGPGTTGSPEFTLETPSLYENLLYQP